MRRLPIALVTTLGLALVASADIPPFPSKPRPQDAPVPPPSATEPATLAAPAPVPLASPDIPPDDDFDKPKPSDAPAPASEATSQRLLIGAIALAGAVYVATRLMRRNAGGGEAKA